MRHHHNLIALESHLRIVRIIDPAGISLSPQQFERRYGISACALLDDPHTRFVVIERRVRYVKKRNQSH